MLHIDSRQGANTPLILAGKNENIMHVDNTCILYNF